MTKTCQACGRKTESAAAFCMHCSARFGAAAPAFEPVVKTAERPSQVACPRCRNKMTLLQYGDVELDECPECSGLWFDKGELGRASAKFRADRQAAPGSRRSGGGGDPMVPLAKSHAAALACPRCTRQLERVSIPEHAGVILDRCAQCGVWVDGHEVDRIFSKAGAASRRPLRRRRSISARYMRRSAENDLLGAALPMLLWVLAPRGCHHRHHCHCW